MALPLLSFRVRALPKKFRRFPDPILFSLNNHELSRIRFRLGSFGGLYAYPRAKGISAEPQGGPGLPVGIYCYCYLFDSRH